MVYARTKLTCHLILNNISVANVTSLCVYYIIIYFSGNCHFNPFKNSNQLYRLLEVLIHHQRNKVDSVTTIVWVSVSVPVGHQQVVQEVGRLLDGRAPGRRAQPRVLVIAVRAVLRPVTQVLRICRYVCRYVDMFRYYIKSHLY